ncbi:MAG: hypothetical protein AAF598_09990 [Bacteroidota bacterium]
MKKPYPYFQALLLAWYQGHKTGMEIKEETHNVLDLAPYEAEYELFIDALEVCIDEYDDDIGYEWVEYKDQAEDTAPTVNGLCHNIDEVIAGNQPLEAFLDWATWHNIDGGETTAGIFENANIEHYCLTFLPENEEQLSLDVLERSIPIIKKSGQLESTAFMEQIKALL